MFTYDYLKTVFNCFTRPTANDARERNSSAEAPDRSHSDRVQAGRQGEGQSTPGTRHLLSSVKLLQTPVAKYTTKYISAVRCVF